MTTKTYTVAGTSYHNGKTKVRFTNDLASRVRTLHKDGHEQIRMVGLPFAMTKTEACAWMYDSDYFTPDECQEAIENWVVNNGDTSEFIREYKESEPKIVGRYYKQEFEPDF